jgi:hypothetical protein
MRKAVTTDISVLQGWPKGKSATSAEIAAALGITVFQITARLKGMEGRGFVARENGRWLRTEKGAAEAKNPSPSVAKKPAARQLNVLGYATGAPDDSRVPLIEKIHCAPSEFAFNEARRRLPKVKHRLRALLEDPAKNRHAIMVLRTELSHCRAVLKAPREDCWFHRRIKADAVGVERVDVYVAPDGREYVRALPFEIADVRIAMPDGLDPVRLRLYTTSAVARRDAAASKEQTSREAARQERLEQKRKNAAEANTVVSADDTVRTGKATPSKAERVRRERAFEANVRRETARSGKSTGGKDRKAASAVRGKDAARGKKARR